MSSREDADLSAATHDASVPKRIEIELRESRDRLRAFFQNSPDIVALTDSQGLILDINRVAAGYEREQVVGRSFAEFLTPDQTERFRRALSEAIETGKPTSYEAAIPSPAGSVYHWFNRIAPVGPPGDCRQVVINCTDISERKAAELALRKSERNLALAQHIARIGSWRYDVAAKCIAWSDQLFEIYERDPRAGAPSLADVMTAIHNDDRAAAEAAFRGALEDGVAYRIVYRITLSSGEVRWVEGIGQAERDENGRIVAVYGTGQDVTERRRADERFHESETRYRRLIESTVDWVWEVDARGRYVYSSSNVEQHIGVAAEDLIGRTPFDFMDPQEAERVGQVFGVLAQRKARIVGLEDTMWHTDGREVVFETNGAPILDDEGQLRGYFGTCRNITAERQAELALRESERQKQLILESTAEMVAYYDTNLRVIWANRAAAASVARSTEELMGQFCYQIWNGSPTPCAGCPVLRAKESKSPQQTERQTPDGRWWSLRGYPVLDEAGDVMALVEFGQDITERKLAEEERARLREQVLQSQRLESIGRLAGGVAHDLNNLLAPIVGYGELLLEEVDREDERHASLTSILHAGQCARDLVRQLLAFGRRQPLEFRTLDVNVLIREFERLMQRTIREDVSVHLDLAQDLPAIRGDATQIEQILMNLVFNAQDAMPGGGDVTIATRRADVPTTDPSAGEANADRVQASGASVAGTELGGCSRQPGVVLTVSDTGSGMSAEARERIFEPFFTTKGREQGTGLGLAVVHGIVKQHGGEIRVESQPGSGTTMRVFFPVADAPPDPDARAHPAPRSGRGEETILLAEDDDRVRNLVVRILERQGYTVLPARDGVEALALARRYGGDVHLLLTDMIMPRMSGGELARTLRARHPSIRILLMSGYAEDVIEREVGSAGSMRLLPKPFSVKTLAAVVRELLDQEGS